jgi:predicted HTH domain antitoxin
MSVTIPDDIVQSTHMTEDELKIEIAVMLYNQQKIGSGKARC